VPAQTTVRRLVTTSVPEAGHLGAGRVRPGFGGRLSQGSEPSLEPFRFAKSRRRAH
jgi:hypothetical protein